MICIKSLNLTRTLGLICLALAIAARTFLHPATTLARDSADAFTGFMFGLGIAFLLVYLFRNGRQNRISAS